MSQPANVDPQEVAKFEALAARWWDREGEFKPLHDINPLRANFIDELSPVAGARLADVGCGGGILSEAMAQRGAEVTGIDMGEAPLAVARTHLEGIYRRRVKRGRMTADEAQEKLALVHYTLRYEGLSDVDIVIEGGHVRTVEAHADRAGAIVIDMGDLAVLPGLVDVHARLPDRRHPAVDRGEQDRPERNQRAGAHRLGVFRPRSLPALGNGYPVHRLRGGLSNVAQGDLLQT